MILIINLGLKSIRAIVFDDRGRRIATASRPVNSRLSGTRVEQSVHEWRKKLTEVVREVIDTGRLRNSISHVTVSCSASCLVPVDQDLSPTAHVIMVSDKRATEEGKALAAMPEFLPLAKKYGFSASQYSQLARIMWLRNHDPEEF